jgi:hypothetical protein
VIELHLIGYTEDGDHLVLDLDADGEGRYLLEVDPDLLATLEAVREERLATGKPVDERPEPAAALPADEPKDPGPEVVHREPFAPTRDGHAENGRGPAEAADDPAAGAAPRAAGSAPATLEPSTPEPVAPASAEDLTADPDTDPADSDANPDDAGPGDAGPGDADPDDPDADEAGAPSPATAVRSRLTPAEIQARLRAGRSVRAVAKEAGVDREWVERWHDPIRAERERVLADARSRRVDHPKARPLGAAVDRSLSERGVSPTEARWRVVRRDDGRWRVSVRFEERGRPRTATWLLDPDAERLRAQSRLATELAAPRRRTSRR